MAIARVNRSGARPYSAIEHVGIGIRNVEPNQQHVGILYRDRETKQVMFLHLALHRDLRLQLPDERYLWIDPDIDAYRLRQVAAICRQLWDQNGSDIPFGFGAPNDCFDEQTFEFLIRPTLLGLTCATFVCAVFQRAGLQLLAYESWPPRSDDVEWQQHVIGILERAGADPEHIAALRGQVGAVRIRPEEVAAAAALAPHPVAFNEASKVAEQILNILCPPLDPSTPKQ